ncbi:hydantoinase B/oxoprolinase family protein, partial [Chloroflexota bacterium]
MANKTTFKLRTHAADFEVLASGFYFIAQEMGLVMERTARSPVYFSAHDFISAILTPEGDLISMAEYIPILIGTTPFHVKAITQYFGDDINPGDVFLVNDPYTCEGGNHLADWCIVYPVFYKGRLKYMIGQKAHQQDSGGGIPGSYNPNALDVWGEGLRIPPVKIIEHGQERKDVLNLILTNVRVYETQRGDLLSLIGASKVGERRLVDLLDKYGEETVSIFITDLLDYAEFRIREEIDKVADGTYHGETKGRGDVSPIVSDITIKGSNMIVDMRKSSPQVKECINSPIANTYSALWMAILTSLGKNIERQYRNSGCFRPIKLLTTPGTIVHALVPATVGSCTLFIAKQIIEIVWDALSKVVPEETSAGWGCPSLWSYSGVDPRRSEAYGTPDFLTGANGAGAIWGTDGWSTATCSINGGCLAIPEIEVVESIYPLFREKWMWVTDSGGPGKWRGGL